MNTLRRQIDDIRDRLGGGSLLPLGILLLLNTVDELDRSLFGTLGPEIKAAFGLSNAGYTAIVGIVLPVGLLAAMPMAVAADRFNRVRLTWGASLVWAAGSALTGAAPWIAMLLGARIASSIALVSSGPVHRSLLADYYPPSGRSTAYATHGFGSPFGAIIGPLLGGLLATLIGWRWAFAIVGIPSVFLALAARRRLEEPDRGATDEAADDAVEDDMPLRLAVRYLLGVPTMRRIAVGLGVVGVTTLGLVPIASLFYEEVFGLGPLGRGVALSLVSVGSAIGLLLGGVLADRMASKDKAALLYIPGAALLASAPALVLTAYAPNVYLSVAAAVILGIATGAFAAPLYAAVSLVAPASIRGKAFGLVNLSLLAGVFFVPIAGAIGDSAGLRLGMAVLAAPLVVGGAVIAFGGRSLLEDLDTPAELMRLRPRRPLRQAREIPSVKLLGRQALFLGAVLWAMLLGGVNLAERAFGVSTGAAVGLVILSLFVVAYSAIGATQVAWRPALHIAAGAAIPVALWGLAVAADRLFVVPLVVVLAGAMGWLLAGATQIVRRAVPTDLRSAAYTWLLTMLASGILLTGITSGISSSAGLQVASAWLAGGAALAAIAGPFLLGSVSRDERRADARVEAWERKRAEIVAGVDVPLVEATGVDVAYGTVQVLFDISFQLQRGELLALLGTNGAGKSTLLNAVSGFQRPQSGSIALDGEDITGLLPEEIAAQGMLLVPGGKATFPELSVMENLRMGAFLTHRNTKDFEAATDPIFDLFPRLAERRHHLGGLLSGGERQMLAVAQCLYADPKVLLIDELSLGLAPAIVSELLERVRAIAATGTGVILVEQSVNVALSVVDRALFMEKGEIRFSGPAGELLDRPDVLRSVFLEGAARGMTEAVPS